MPTEPILSVIIATYKSKPSYLRDAIRSALNQDVNNLEVIVTDDSPDDSVELVVREIEDARCRYRRNTSTPGPASNHFSALAEARAPYIAILNHDDVWQPEFASTLIGALQSRSESVLAFCDHWVIGSSSEKLESATEQNTRLWSRQNLSEGYHSNVCQLLIQQTVPLAMGCVFRKSALPRQIDAADPGPAYDLWLTYWLLASGSVVYYTPARLSCWRIHGDNITSTGDLAWAKGAAACWSMIEQDPGMRSIRTAAARKASLSWREAAAISLRRLDRKSAWSCSKSSLRFHLNWRAAVLMLSCILPAPVLRFALKDRSGIRAKANAQEPGKTLASAAAITHRNE